MIPNTSQELLADLVKKHISIEEIQFNTGIHERTLYRIQKGFRISSRTYLSLLNFYLVFKSGARDFPSQISKENEA